MAGDIDRWLEGLGLSTYAEAFRANDIDVETLPLLTAEDLQQIGVRSVGHRRRLLEAIAAMGRVSTAPEEKPAASRAPVSERRQITVMFCDLVDSTALSARLDPEDLHELLTAYRACVAEAVRRNRGFIAHYVGDGVFVYFGYPHAQEQDAERALRAGLAIIRELGRLKPVAGAAPQVRIGVATGLVVIGNVTGGGAADKVDVTGETPNLAARIQGLARANALVIAESTRALVGDLFDCTEIGRFELKGLPEPVPAWRVTAERSVVSRYEAMRSARGTIDLIGRESELARIGDRLAATRAGAGQVVLVVSEPGFGKSRLVEEVHRISGAGERARFVLQCSPDQEQTPFHPVIHQLEYAAAIATGDTAAERQVKIGALLERIGAHSPERLAIVLDLLRIDAADTSPATPVLSGNARTRTLKGLIDIAEAALRLAPVMVFEDVQWADPSTVEFLGLIVDMVRNVPALIVVTARPEFAAGWEDLGHVSVLRLDRLPPPELRRLILDLARDESLPSVVVDQIVARSDGVPLFAQELTRGSLASGRRQGGMLAIPSTLTESLLARLDGLAHGRETAQLAAVIGREFPVDLLMAVSAEEADATREGVRRLLEAGIFVKRHSSFGEAAGFHHMLVRDAAYELLLRRDRVRLHGKVAIALERQFPDMATAMPQLVAHHFTEAGSHARAIDYWEKAGADAAARSAPVEAIAHYEKALEVLQALPTGTERDERGLGLRLDQIAPLIAARGHGSADVAAAVDEALDLQRRLGSQQSIVPALTLKWLAQLGSGDIDALYATALQIRRSATGAGVIDRLLAHRTVGSTLMFRGELASAVGEFTAFLELYDPAQHDALLARSGATNHAGVAMLCLAECFTLMGDRTESARWREAVLVYSRERNHVPSLCQVLAFGGCWLSALLGDIEGLVLYAAELRSLIARNNLEPWRPHVDLLSGLGDIHRGSIESGFVLARRGIDALVAAKAFLLSTWAMMFAEVCERHGRIEEARAMLAVAEQHIAAGERWVEAEFLRLRGRLKRTGGRPTADAKVDLEAALAIATRQGAGLLGERVRTDLADDG